MLQMTKNRKIASGASHPGTLTSMGKPAATYNNRGRRKKAEELFVQVMETFERLLRPEHLNTQIGIDNLALTERHQHRNREALGAQRCEQVQEERGIH